MFIMDAPFYRLSRSVALASVAIAQAVVIPAPVTAAVIGGYSVAGDAPAVEYKRVAVEPAHAGKFQDLAGAWFELASNDIAAENFGAVGDNATNDYTAWQNAINFASTKGAKIYGWGLRSYRVNSSLIFKTGVEVDFMGATINSNLVGTGGSDYGPRAMSNTTLKNGTLNTLSSGSIGSQGIWHSALSLGNAYGDQSTDINNPNAYDEVSGVIVDNMTLNTNASGKVALATIGLIHDCRFTNITIPASATLGGCFGYDWGVIGSSVAGVGIASDPTQMNASKTYFEAGSGTTRHGYNIVVENWKIGALTKAGPDYPTAIRFSAGYGYTVNNITVASCTGAPFVHTAGDLGLEFALASVKPFACKDYSWTNCQCYDTGVSPVMLNDSHADNITRAMLPGPDGCNYVPLMEPIQTTNCVWSDIVGNSTSGASDRGAIFYFVIGGTYNNFVLSGYVNGIEIQESAARLTFNKPVVFNNRGAGISVNQDLRTAPDRILINEPICYKNGTNTFLTSKFRSNIYINRSTNVTVNGGQFGNTNIAFDTAETALYGVLVDDSASGVILSNNHIYKVNGGVGIVCGLTTTSYGKVALFQNNTCEAGITLVGGANIIPIQRYATPTTGSLIVEYSCDKATCAGNNPPAGFVSNTGDIIRFRDPDAASNYGLFCHGGGISGSGASWKTLNGIGG